MGIFDKLKDMLDGDNEQKKDQDVTADSTSEVKVDEWGTDLSNTATDATSTDVQVDEWGTDLSNTATPATEPEATTESGEGDGARGTEGGSLLGTPSAEEQQAEAQAAMDQVKQAEEAKRAEVEAGQAAAAQAQAAQAAAEQQAQAEAAQKAQADAAAQAQADAAAAAAAQPQQYTVVEGDTLWDISQTYGTTVDALVDANGIENPDLIFPGQVLTIPK